MAGLLARQTPQPSPIRLTTLEREDVADSAPPLRPSGHRRGRAGNSMAEGQLCLLPGAPQRLGIRGGFDAIVAFRSGLVSCVFPRTELRRQGDAQ